MSTGPVSLAAYARLLRSNRNFRFLWAAQMVSEVGDWLYSVAIYSLLLEFTGSGRAVGVAVVLQVLPQFFVSPLAGSVCDRVSRKHVMIFADLARAAIVLGMLAVRSPEQVWLVYVLLALESVMWGFFEPARTAVVPNLTRDHQELLVANALSSTTWSFNVALGSLLGGLVAVAFGTDTVFVLNSLTFLGSAWCIQHMAFAEPHIASQASFQWRDLFDFTPVLDGIRYVAADVRLFATLLVKAGLGLLATHWVLLPIFGREVFPVHLGTLERERAAMLGMSLLMGSRGVGALVGPLAGGRWARESPTRLRTGILLGFLCVSAGYIGLAFSASIVVAIAMVILAHAGSSVVWVFSTTLLHIQTEDRYRGRVFAADFAFLVATMALISWLSGTAIDRGLPARTIAFLTGVLALAPAWLWKQLAMPLWSPAPAPSSPNHPDA